MWQSEMIRALPISLRKPVLGYNVCLSLAMKYNNKVGWVGIGNAFHPINEFTLRRARLVLG